MRVKDLVRTFEGAPEALRSAADRIRFLEGRLHELEKEASMSRARTALVNSGMAESVEEADEQLRELEKQGSGVATLVDFLTPDIALGEPSDISLGSGSGERLDPESFLEDLREVT